MILNSASQIKAYRECVRRWGLTRIAKLPTPSTPSQELGKDVDDNQLQPYLRDGKPFDFTRPSGDIAASGMAWLPQPKWRGLEVQKHFVIKSPSGLDFGYQGYLDLWLPFGGQPGFDNNLPVVTDFKTTKSIRKWALKEDALRTDVQAQLYATWAILQTKSKEINLSWLYLQTEGARLAVPTQITVHTDEVAEQFLGIEKDAKEMFKLRSAAPSEGDAEAQDYALSLPGNKNACDDYGGCPFRHLCFTLDDLIDEPAVVSGKKEEVMAIDLMAKLRMKQQGTTGGEPPAPEVQADPTPPTQEQIANEPALGINPPMPEGTPLAPPVGSADAKPKRGRPAGTKNKPKAESPSTEVAAESAAEPEQAVVEQPSAEPVAEPAPEQDKLEELAAIVKKMRELGVASWVNSPVGDLVLFEKA